MLKVIDMFGQKQLTYLTKQCCIIPTFFLASSLFAQQPTDITHYQQQRDEQLQQRIVPQPTIHQNTPVTLEQPDVSTQQEFPCFVIHEIAFSTLQKTDHHDIQNFNFALSPALHGADKVVGNCLGVQGINQLVTDIQNRIITQGYVTTRVMVGQQNLKSGKLILTLIPGYIDQIHANTENSLKSVYYSKQPHLNKNHDLPANFNNALPLRSGQLLNIRDIETGLENLKRVPDTQADFSIKPSENLNTPGYSDIIVQYAQNRRLKTSIGIDDSGSDTTGKYQGNITFSWLNPSSHNDLLYISYGHDLRKLIHEKVEGYRGSENFSAGYVVPVDRWLVNLTGSHYNYHQTVAGANQDYTYQGDSDNYNLNLSYLAHRNSNSKTYITGGSFIKAQKNYIDDTEIEVQRRKIAGFTVGIRREIMYGQKQLNMDIQYQRGIGAFKALTPPESEFNEGTARTGIVKLNLSGFIPLQVRQHPVYYQANLKAQYAQSALVPSERMSIGGRYTVRGFDGERSLSGDHGVLLRQDLAVDLTKQHQFYLGLDAGYVKMRNHEQDQFLLGHQLVGSAIGFKGYIKPLKLSYDIFTGYPIHQPEFFSKKQWSNGFSLTFDF